MSNKDENEHISNTVSDENSDLTCQQRGEIGTELENVSEKQENQPATSSENQNLVYFPDYEIGKRLRKPTEKGKSFQLEILSQKRQSCYRNLAKYLAISIRRSLTNGRGSRVEGNRSRVRVKCRG